ncbi:MAG TPA: multiprotein bridging factor aMBF1 [Candidatus Thermoplasmatota archaeon]|nr:multiprotein bridging factor aMBF1 [Candidatus Thermoplasmatota archaeon]
MPSCEMCGKELPSLRRAIIEGTAMSVCGDCIKFGVEQAGAKHEVTNRSRTTAALENRAVRGRTRDVFSDMPEELVEDYGERVRLARQKLGLSIEDVGKKINERQSELAKLEQGTYHPPDTLVKKLERFFNIKLMEKPEAPAGVGGPKMKAAGPITLGDMIKDELAKNKK